MGRITPLNPRLSSLAWVRIQVLQTPPNLFAGHHFAFAETFLRAANAFHPEHRTHGATHIEHLTHFVLGTCTLAFAMNFLKDFP